MSGSKTLFKDEIMHGLVQCGINVASFVSFGPDGDQRFICVRGVPQHRVFPDPPAAVRALYASGNIEHVNIRTFLPDSPDGNPFFLGVKSGFKDSAVAEQRSQASQRRVTMSS